MDPKVALESLGLGADATTSQIEEAYRRRRAELSGREEHDESKRRFQELEDARRVALEQAGGAALLDLPAAIPVYGGDIGEATVDASRGRHLCEAGQLLADRYEIESFARDGSYGPFYSALDRQDNARVVVHVVLPHIVRAEESRARVFATTDSLLQLDHPAILSIRDAQQAGDLLFFVFPNTEGGSLRHEIDQREREAREFSIDEVRHIGARLADGLDYALARDLSLDAAAPNVILDGKRVQILGLALRSVLGPVPDQPGSATHEEMETTLEVERAEQSALARLLYETLTGEVPVGRPYPARTLRPDVPRALSAALDQAMHVRPDARFSSMGAFGDAIRRRGLSRRMQGIAAGLILVAGFLTGQQVWGQDLHEWWLAWSRDMKAKKQAIEARDAADGALAEWEEAARATGADKPRTPQEFSKHRDAGVAFLIIFSDEEAFEAFEKARATLEKPMLEATAQLRKQAEAAYAAADAEQTRFENYRDNLGRRVSAAETKIRELERSKQANDADKLAASRDDLEFLREMWRHVTTGSETRTVNENMVLGSQHLKAGEFADARDTLRKATDMMAKMLLIEDQRRCDVVKVRLLAHTDQLDKLAFACGFTNLPDYKEARRLCDRGPALERNGEFKKALAGYDKAIRVYDELLASAESILEEVRKTLDKRDSDDKTPLFQAAEEGKARVVALHLLAGADPNAAAEMGQRPLMAAAKAGSEETVAILLGAPAEVNAKDEWERTALHYAVEFGHVAAVERLIDAGANVNSRDDKGRTPLDFAVAQDLREIEKLLRARDARTGKQ